MPKTKIEWTEYSWNPVTGCTPISEGCQNCYARRMANRLRGRCGYPAEEPFRVTLHSERLEEPFKLRKPRKVFVCSMSDLFHENVPDEFIADVFGVMAVACENFCGTNDGKKQIGTYKTSWGKEYPVYTPNYYSGPHTFLVLTKRPDRMRTLLTSYHFRRKVAKSAFKWAMNRVDAGYLSERIDHQRLWPLPNVWLGVTAENQARADERIPILLQIPATVRFVSVEPMLGPVDLSLSDGVDLSMSVGTGLKPGKSYLINSLDWVICGGETGPGARPMHPDWVRSLRDQCQDAGVPFFFKSWGEWSADYTEHDKRGVVAFDGWWSEGWPFGYGLDHPNSIEVYKVGKKRAGRLLDGRTWDEMPEL